MGGHEAVLHPLRRPQGLHDGRVQGRHAALPGDEESLTIVANYGDQWSDLQGGYADHAVKLPNPTYYLPSPNLPGLKQTKLSPRTRFTMAPDGSSGAYVSGEGIPNIDSVKKTIAVYYGDPGTGHRQQDALALHQRAEEDHREAAHER